jgi:hypothetical protein
LFILYPIPLRINTMGIEDSGSLTSLLSPVTISCGADGDTPCTKSILKAGWVRLPSLGSDTTVIIQTMWIWPAWWTQSIGRGSETCTVTVGTCPDTDTFELIYGSFGNPLSE